MIIYFCHSDVPNLDQKLHIINAWHLTAVYVVFVLLLILIQLIFSQDKIGKKSHSKSDDEIHFAISDLLILVLSKLLIFTWLLRIYLLILVLSKLLTFTLFNF